MADLVTELRRRLRSLVRSPGYAAVAVLTLSLGIGATTAIYGVLDAVVLRPLPYEDPDGLVSLLQSLGEEEARGFAPADIDWLLPRAESFAGLAWFRETESMTLTGSHEPEQVTGRRISTSFFDILGVPPRPGRGFRPGEGVEGRDDVVVLAHHFWRERFGSDPDIVGRTLRIDDRTRTVVGITAPGFRFELGGDQDLFVPRVFDPEAGTYTGWFSDGVVGRLAPGVDIGRAQTEMTRLAAILEEEFPNRRTDVPIRVISLHEHLVGDVRPILLVLFAAVGLVLVVACANLTHLALARLTERRTELALRAALGAGRGRLLRGQLVESGIVSAAGVAGGVAVAATALPLFTGLSPAEVPGLTEAALDWRVLLFSGAVGVIVTFGLGLLPLFVLGGSLRGASMMGGGRPTGAGRGLRTAIVVGETAVVTALLLSAGLLVSSFRNLLATDPGVELGDRTAVRITLPAERYGTAPEIQAFFRRVVGRLESIPGVESAAAISTLPLGGEGVTIPAPIPEGSELAGPAVATRPRTGWDAVTRGYFRTVGIPVVRGRTFGPGESADDSIPSIVVSEAFVRAVFGEEDPVGRLVGFGTPPSSWMRVIGVVGDVRHGSLADEPRVSFYQLAEQVSFAWPTMEVVLRGREGAPIPPRAVREAVWEIDPDQPVSRVRSLDAVRRESAARERYQTMIIGAFALLALLLGAVGIYGVVGYATSRRRREFGIRLALGATVEGIRSSVVGSTLLRIGAGLILGLAGGMVIARLLRSWLHGVAPTDPVVAAAVAALLLGTGVLAAWLPARDASATDPVVALRTE